MSGASTYNITVVHIMGPKTSTQFVGPEGVKPPNPLTNRALPTTISINNSSALWSSGIGTDLVWNRLRVRVLAVSDTYPMFIRAYDYLGPFEVLWLHMA